MDNFTPFSLAATGAFLLVPPTKPQAHQMASRLIAILQPPLAAPFAREITALLVDAVEYTIGRLETPKSEVLKVGQDLKELRSALEAACTEVQLHSSELSLRGKASSDPVWYQLAQAAARSLVHRPQQLYIGCAVLLGLHRNSPLPQVAAQHLRDLAEVRMTEATLDALLAGVAPAEHLAESWVSRLGRMWREAVKLFSGGDVPPPTFKNRVTGQLLGAALNPPPAHSAGAQSHRQLSPRQLQTVFHHVQNHIAKDDIEGVLGVLVFRTGLSVDVLMQLPLQTSTAVVSGAHLDPRRGTVQVDLQPLVFEPAQPLLGCHPGGYQLSIHLPLDVARHLQARSDRYPFAGVLMDLYPGSQDVLTRQQLMPGDDEITATWARLRESTGPYLLRQGFNALHAALLTLDFSLICRSKMHYAVVTAREWLQAERQLHAILGWDDPVEPREDGSGLGSRVVPTDTTIRQHDDALVAVVKATWPGPHAAMPALLQFHNQFTALTGWRISMLLAMRATTRISISAALQDGDRWVSLHDKHTPYDRGFQPVPLCPFVHETIALYKRHCEGMGSRLTRLGLGDLPAARWFKSVADHQNVRLLCTMGHDGSVHPLASQAFTRPMNPDYQLPDDPGRKLLENALRAEGLPSVLIDRMLRHTHAGQHHLGSFNLLPSAVAYLRMSQAIERIARRLFGAPVSGLRKD